jgi:hypothetical protein
LFLALGDLEDESKGQAIQKKKKLCWDSHMSKNPFLLGASGSRL